MHSDREDSRSELDDDNFEKLEYQQKRNKTVVKLRRQNRADVIWKRRLGSIDNSTQDSDYQCQTELTIDQNQRQNLILDPSIAPILNEFIHQEVDVSMTSGLIACILHEDVLIQHRGAIGLRKLLVFTDKPPLLEILTCKIEDRLCQFALQREFLHLQYEAVWILANLVAGPVQEGTFELSKKILKTMEIVMDYKDIHHEIMHCAIWGIGNITIDYAEIKDKIVKEGIATKILNLVENSLIFTEFVASGQTLLLPFRKQPNEVHIRLKNNEMQDTVTQSCWIFSNLVRGKTRYNLPIIGEMVKIMCQLITHNIVTDETVLIDCVWAISNYAIIDDPYFKFIIESRLIQKLIRICIAKDIVKLKIGLLKICNNVVLDCHGPEKKIIDYFIASGLYQFLNRSIRHKKPKIRKQSCELLFQITARGSKYIDQLVEKQQNLIGSMADMFKSESQQETIRIKLAYIFANMTVQATDMDMEMILIEGGLIQGYINLLKSANKPAIIASLRNLRKILVYAEKKKCHEHRKNNLIAVQLQRLKGVLIMEELQHHPSNKIYDMVASILDRFYEFYEPNDEKESGQLESV